jgi:hypothetical protein
MVWRNLEWLIYWASFLVFPFVIFIIWKIWRNPAGWYWWVLLILSVLFFYARFVEPQQIRVWDAYYSFKNHSWEKTDLKKVDLKVAVISDLHLGVYKDSSFLLKVVNQLNDLKPDLVLIPGDFVFDPDLNELEDNLLVYLGQLSMPVVAVTGNHDAKSPGYIEAEEVRRALTKYGVKVIDNDMIQISFGKRVLQVAGLSDLMEGKYSLKPLNNLTGRNSIILAHNPDMAYLVPNSSVVSALVISGHTHGGQIRIPFVYKWVIPTKHNFDSGWYKVLGRAVLVSSGMGEVLLPVRLGVPPEIIMLNLELV